MSLPKMKHKIINELDIENLLRTFTLNQLAIFFGVNTDYIYKTRTLQRVKEEEKFNKNYYNELDEMKIGRIGSWMNSKQRNELHQWKLINKEKLNN